MSENAVTPVKPKKRYLKVLFIFLLLVIVFLVYAAGTVLFPLFVYGSFQNKNCDRALTWYKVYADLYPVVIQDKSLVAPARECEAYGSAAAQEEKGSWREAYDAYQVYVSTYPDGLYAGEAREHSALVLVNIVKEQVEQKKYEEAAANLNRIISDYAGTGASAESWSLGSSIYTAWGKDLREAKDFEGAERVLNDFKSWSEHYQQNDLATTARRELVQTYLAWALELQAQKQYENALAKFDLAAAADLQGQFDTAAQVKAGPGKLYVEWGNDLLEQKDFPAAIAKFEQGGTNEGAKDALANGQIQWATALSGAEDFLGALDHLKLAQEAAGSEAMKKSVETALQDTYLAFSKSSGQQARKAMKDVLKTVCEKHKAPDLPIFGLDKDTVRFGIYGVEDQLPADLVAKTPGQMHYISCIKTDNRTVQSRTHRVILLKVSHGYWYTVVEQFRVQIVWVVTLRDATTGESVGEQTFTGEEPPPFSEVGGNYFFGSTPMDDFREWLVSFNQ